MRRSFSASFVITRRVREACPDHSLPQTDEVLDLCLEARIACRGEDGDDAQPQALGQFQGRLVLLNFGATWCAPCRDEMPVLSAAADRLGKDGLVVVGLSSETEDAVRGFARDHPVAYPLWTGGEAVSALGKRLGNADGVLPYSALIGPDGKVLDQKVGPYTQEELAKRVRLARVGGG